MHLNLNALRVEYGFGYVVDRVMRYRIYRRSPPLAFERLGQCLVNRPVVDALDLLERECVFTA